tara:strand:+ start:1511 stop:2353 length:843 start_codon:yes stop_codon:yes gene_type:complete
LEKVKNIFKDTCVLVTGNINSDENDFEKIKSVALHNKPIFDKCKMMVVIYNKMPEITDEELIRVNNFYKENFENCYIIPDWANRGWQIGHADQDKVGFSFVQHNFSDVKFIFKVSHDVLVTDEILDISVDEDSKFLYQPAINLMDLIQHFEGDVDRYYDEFNKKSHIDWLSPQTTHYILSTDIDYPYCSSQELHDRYKKWIEKGAFNVSQTLVMADEHELSKSILRNKFKRQMLISKNEFINILKCIQENNIGDPSLKNVFISEIGICHWQYKNQEVIKY